MLTDTVDAEAEAGPSAAADTEDDDDDDFAPPQPPKGRPEKRARRI